MQKNSILAQNSDFDLIKLLGQDKIPISNLWMGQNPYIQLAVFEVPQLSQYLELEAHLWTGRSVVCRLYETAEQLGKLVHFQFF